eukprot:4442077-Amphidinium_carterae.1
MVAIRGRHHNVLRDHCEGSNEQGALTSAEQTILPRDQQEMFDRGTALTNGCYKMGNHTTAYQQWYKGQQVQIMLQRLFTIHPRHRHPNICSYTFINGNATTPHNRHHQAMHSLHNRRGQCFHQYTYRRGSHCTTPKRVIPQPTQCIVEDDKSTLGSTHITQTMARTPEYNPWQAWLDKTPE